MKRLVIAALALVSVFAVAGSALAASSQSATIYDSTVNTGPKSNLPSDGLEANSAAQIGSQVNLQSPKRHLTSATVTLSSWACKSGHWSGHDSAGNPAPCVTPTGATYSLPIMLNIYNSDGTLLTSKQQAFNVAYRPSANPAKCPSAPTKWWSTTDKQCYNGLAQDVTFTFDGTKSLPDHFSYGIAYGTSHYGSPSYGEQDCSSTAAGCFYDSLNVAVPDTGGAYSAAQFLDANGASIGNDPGYTPAIQFKAGS
jgi:hypothetical protein